MTRYHESHTPIYYEGPVLWAKASPTYRQRRNKVKDRMELVCTISLVIATALVALAAFL